MANSEGHNAGRVDINESMGVIEMSDVGQVDEINSNKEDT